MRTSTKTLLASVVIIASTAAASAQNLRLGEVLLVSTSGLSEADSPVTFGDCVKGIAREWHKDGAHVSIRAFTADRGGHKGQPLVVIGAETAKDREALVAGSPFADETLAMNFDVSCKLSDVIKDVATYTEYRLISTKGLKSLPMNVGILGMHYIKVKKGNEAEFEKFVIDKLNPTIGNIFPDLRLLYYKAVAGDNAGSYLTIFALATFEARDKYWPGGKDAQILKDGFKPYEKLAQQLQPFLVEGSFLESGKGFAAAIFESKEWTDFVVME